MSRARYEKFQQVLRRRQPDMTILTDQVHKAHNISAILRTADAVGIPAIHMVKPEKPGLLYHHTAGGSGRYVTRRVHDTIAEGINHLRRQGFELYAADDSPGARPYRELDYTRPFALIMGAEKYGLSDYARTQADQAVSIPIVGMVESYNVSVAAAIILQEAMHQRIQAGLYEREPSDPEAYRATLFRWMHPAIAKYCDKHQLPYPPLDDEGDLLDRPHRDLCRAAE